MFRWVPRCFALVSMPGAELWWSTGWHCWERSCTFLCSENMSMFLFRFCSDRLSIFNQTFRWLYNWCDGLIHFLIHLSCSSRNSTSMATQSLEIKSGLMDSWNMLEHTSRPNYSLDLPWLTLLVHLDRPDYATLCKGTFIDNHDTYQLAIVKNSGYSCKMINRTCSILK